MPSGFLVVLPPIQSPSTGRSYAGVDRLPYYPPEIPGEAELIDKYVFGEIKNFDSNLIDSFERAKELQISLSEKGRDFEVIYCRHLNSSLPKHLLTAVTAKSLGYDVAGIKGDYWSIVNNFSSRNWAVSYKERLNTNGLFPQHSDAESYLREYQKHGDVDWNSDFDIVEVFQIQPKV